MRTLAGIGQEHSIHHVGAEHGSYVWDNSLEPGLEVESGTTVMLECGDVSGGQMTQSSTAEDVKALDLTRVNPPQGQLAGTERSRYHVCTDVHPNLIQAAKKATRATIAHIEQRYGRSRQEAYAIASTAVDLRIHEIVDAPNWVVGAFLPEAIFTEES